MNRRRHLVTGATGLVGGAIVLELLQETDDTVLCLVRAGSCGPGERLRDSLVDAAEAYDRGHLIPEIDRRCEALAGDVVEPSCGVQAGKVAGVEVVWHCAASLRFEDRFAAEIHRINVDGTRNLIDLTRTTPAELNYVSTAYVAGTRTGSIGESAPVRLSLANNHYERSKITAELAVSGSGVPWRILRPSIVIGHSVTRAATTFSGLYGMANAMLLFAGQVRRQFGHVLDHRRLPVRLEREVQLNMIPVDLVAANAVLIGTTAEPGRVFHLTNDAHISAVDAVAEVFNCAGLRDPHLVSDVRRMTTLDRILDDSIDFYRQYLRSPKTFDRANTDAICGVQASRFELNRALLRRHLEWYVERVRRDGRAGSPARPAHAYRAARPASLASA